MVMLLFIEWSPSAERCAKNSVSFTIVKTQSHEVGTVISCILLQVEATEAQRGSESGLAKVMQTENGGVGV